MKPMLCHNKVVTPDQVTYPIYASPKYDGIRCMTYAGSAYTRNEKLIPNDYVRNLLKDYPNLDGELILKDPKSDFNDCQSAFMSKDGEPDFMFMVFDMLGSNKHCYSRCNLLQIMESKYLPSFIHIIYHILIISIEELSEYYELCLSRGDEGVVLNKIHGLYKHGRSTFNEGLALKMKPKLRAEADIVELTELHDATGAPQNTFGSAVVSHLNENNPNEDIHTNVGTGPGLTQEKRQEIWDNKEKYLGKQLTVEYDSITKYGKFRFPRWIGIRHEGTE